MIRKNGLIIRNGNRKNNIMKKRMRGKKIRMIWKNGFMKYNISRDKNSMSKEIKQFVTFDVIRIANEKTRLSPGIKLRTISSKSRGKT